MGKCEIKQYFQARFVLNFDKRRVKVYFLISRVYHLIINF